MKVNFENDNVRVFWEENWYSIRIENIRLLLGLNNDEEITEEIIEKFMKKYY